MHRTATRPLRHTAATLTMLISGLLAAPAGAAEGVDRCPGATTVPESPDDLKQAAGATFCLVNAERSRHGLPELRRDRDLARAAREHSADMVRRDYFSHVSPTGKTLNDRLRDAGYGRPGDGWSAGENLGWGTGWRATPNALVDAWRESPRHRRILLADGYRELGIGVSGGAPEQDGSRLPGATYTMDVGTIRSG